MSITRIKKRDGRIADFDKEKIAQAIFKAAESVGGKDKQLAEKLAEQVVQDLESKFDGGIPSVEDIQDAVEQALIKNDHARTAKAFIIYRAKRKETREEKSAILGVGKMVDTKLSVNAIRLLKERYLLKDPEGKVVETPDQLLRRVARNIAQGDLAYDKGADINATEEKFYQMMKNLDFLPNSPTLMNAGTGLQQLSACFVLPVPDSIEGIFSAVKDTATIHKSGGGTGFSFSRLRPRNDLVMSTKGVASGPLSFMRVFDVATDVIKQGGKRRGANMAILRVDHPDIMDFIVAKEKEGVLANFNISVGLTEKFMKAVSSNREYELLNPKTGDVVKKLPARQVFDLIVLMAWKNGEPGIVFLDKLNKDNPTPAAGIIESTNPCGEQPLLPYESCNLGSLNLANFVKDGKLDYDRLREIVRISVHFLDNVIDMNRYPLERIDEMTKSNRKIGLGVMGFADMLFQLNIAYNSRDAEKAAEKVMKFIQTEARKMSVEFGEKRGSFPNFDKSVWAKKFKHMRNATVTTIAPTGSISMIADCSSGIEPLFSISFIKKVLDGKEFLYVNRYFESAAKENGFYSEELMKNIANLGSLQQLEEIPKNLRKIFVVSHDVVPEWHIKIQAAFQKYVDNAVSKTINFPNKATPKDVEEAYMMSYKLGCKGLTIYRDQSRDEQVLNITLTEKDKKKKKKEKRVVPSGIKCPECGHEMIMAEGCKKCPSCGYAVCG